jgi:cytochrome c oxidase assembly protein Cox11
MADCPETETVTVPVVYFIDADVEGLSGSQAFGPVYSLSEAYALLRTLSGRSNVNKATLRKETA